MTKIISILCRPRFDLAAIVATPGALEATSDGQRFGYLRRHSTGDWGTVCEEDRRISEAAVKEGHRIVSAYPIDPAKPFKGYGENCIWIITESDRSVTTFLLPSEY